MYPKVKRITDILLSSLGLILLAPLLALISLWIKLESPGPVIFRQKRWGKNQSVFICYKFRTMTIDAPDNYATKDLKEASKYITTSGHLLRRAGLDELPQLINVLRGEMSIIGPRPVILSEKKLIQEREKYGANSVLPGIGGWAQSNGRDEVSIKEKALLDGEYAQNFGFIMDISCTWRTIVAVFTSKGFKEGHIGDTPYKRRVSDRTKQPSIGSRLIQKIKPAKRARGKNA